MTLFALCLGFLLGAAFYVLGGRGTALGDLELPQRLGLVVVVGVVLMLVALLFDRDADDAVQSAGQDRVRSEQQATPAPEDVTGAPTAAGTETVEPAATEAAATADEPTDPPAESTTGPTAESITTAPEPGAEPAPQAAVAAPAPGAAAAEPEQPELQCVYSVDSDRCVCFDRTGAPVEVELERCREIAAGDGS